jgi:RimJ/RimL family protein N-acetyltransferase
MPPPPPPYRIETPRLVVRCWEPRDAALLKDAIDSSLDHLRPWLPWIREEPQTIDEKVDLLRGFRGGFDRGEDFVYGVFSADEREVLGGSGLHRRVDESAFEIGYWVRASAAGRGIATEAAAALTRVAFSVCGVDRVEIHVDPDNAPSRRVPEKLGYVKEGRLRRRLPPRTEGDAPCDMLIYSIWAADAAVAALPDVVAAAQDAAGRSVPNV